jgi:hypothetical protein
MLSTRSLVAGLGLCASSLLFSTACPDEPTEEFGFTCIELLQAESEEENPFLGTAEIKATLRYEPCLIDYYTKLHVEERLDAPEGRETFERWRERLCNEGVTDPLVPCEVESIDSFGQQLIDAGMSSVYQMTITYKVTDASLIRGRNLLWGPGPTESFAECQMGQKPFVYLALPGDIIGLDGAGKPLWQVLSYSNPRGIMQRNTAGCIQVEIAKK